MKPAGPDPLHKLLSAVVDNTIDESDLGALSSRLETDPDARRIYVRYMDMHAALMAGEVRPFTLPPRRAGRLVMVASLLAASLMLVWLGSFVGRPGGERNVPLFTNAAAAEPVEAGYIATIVSVSDATKLNGQAGFAAGRLTPGEYDLTAGSLTIRFDGGAHLFFDGPARFTLQSRRRLKIERGTFVFTGDQSCESIDIETPHSVIRNLGTVYAAVINAAGEDLHVAKGSVQRTVGEPIASQRRETIEAGVGRRYAARKSGAEPIPLDAALLERSKKKTSSATVPPRAVVVDDFAGNQKRIRGLRSGRGWAEPWRSGRDELRLVPSGLGGKGTLAVEHDGVGSEADGRRNSAHRLLDVPLDLSKDGIWYVRFLVRRGLVKSNDEHLAMVVLRTHGLSAEREIEQGSLIQIALRREDTVFVRLAGTLNRVSIPQVPDQTYAVIAKIVAGRTRPEQVLVRVMAAERLATSHEPTDWSLVSDSVHTDIRLDQMSLECVSGGRIQFGDIRIGPTWESVASPVSEP